jgi:hypothetical protein
MNQMIPMSREQLQQEGVDGEKRAQIQGMIRGYYTKILATARAGQTEYFMPVSVRMNTIQPVDLNTLAIPEDMLARSRNQAVASSPITHGDIIEELGKIFPGVTMSSIEEKRTQQMVYQQAGILLNWG